MSAEKPRISAFVITKNNGDKIAGCLESLGWADEVIVVDDFSTDETPNICRSFPNVRFSQNTFSGFQEQKIHAMAQTANDWVLKVDADEQVTPEMRDSILSLTGDDVREYACFEFRRLTCFWGKWIRHGSFYPDYNPRLFNKHEGAWGGINPHDKFMTRGRTRKLAGDILHFQNWDLYTYACRTALYSNISAIEYHGRGRKAHWHQVTFRPLYTFLYRYFFRLGMLDGWQGFVISIMGAYGTFLKYMKIHELQHGKVPVRMERP